MSPAITVTWNKQLIFSADVSTINSFRLSLQAMGNLGERSSEFINGPGSLTVLLNIEAEAKAKDPGNLLEQRFAPCMIGDEFVISQIQDDVPSEPPSRLKSADLANPPLIRRSQPIITFDSQVGDRLLVCAGNAQLDVMSFVATWNRLSEAVIQLHLSCTGLISSNDKPSRSRLFWLDEKKIDLNVPLRIRISEKSHADAYASSQDVTEDDIRRIRGS